MTTLRWEEGKMYQLRSDMDCVYCEAKLPEDPHDTTYCNYNSPRYSEGTHTGNIYRCAECGEDTIELVQEGGRLESWSYAL